MSSLGSDSQLLSTSPSRAATSILHPPTTTHSSVNVNRSNGTYPLLSEGSSSALRGPRASTQAVFTSESVTSEGVESRAHLRLPFQTFEKVPHHDGIYRFDSLWELGNCLNPIPVSCFLIQHGDDSFTLIDCGLEETEVSLAESLVRTCGDRLKNVLITHAHVDHVGGLPAVLSQFPEVKVYIHRAEYPFLLGQLQYSDLPPESCCSMFGCFRSVLQENTNLVSSRHLPRIMVVDRDVSDLIPEIDIICSPGHTPGHLAFYHRASRSLFCGDAFMNILTPQLSCCCCPRVTLMGPPSLSTPDLPTAKKSMIKLALHDFNYTLFCAHDETIDGVEADRVRHLLNLNKEMPLLDSSDYHSISQPLMHEL